MKIAKIAELCKHHFPVIPLVLTSRAGNCSP